MTLSYTLGPWKYDAEGVLRGVDGTSIQTGPESHANSRLLQGACDMREVLRRDHTAPEPILHWNLVWWFGWPIWLPVFVSHP